MRLFKVLNVEGLSTGGQEFPWPLPRGKRLGKWLPPVEGDLVAYENGYHVCTTKQLLGWLGPMIWEVEVRGEVVHAGLMTVVRSARIIALKHWDQRIARLFACDCATRALRRERRAGREPDKRSWEAIRVARLYAEGKATNQELIAAGVAAGYAFTASEVAWTSGKAATKAAWNTTAAAWATTEVAPGARAWATWNTTAATIGAAWNASEAAACAASAAWDGAGHAAWKAERRWQALRLLKYLDGKRGRPEEVTP